MSTPTAAPSTEAIAALESFQRNLRVLMARDNLKAPGLASRIGVSRLWVARRQNGEVVPDLADLARIAAALNVPVSDLVSLDEPTTTYIPGGAS